jgi:uncharacterized SAM-binding protein YcdF (DUF218 family)
MFWLKKVATVWLMPLTFCLTLLLLGLWLLYRGRRTRLGRWLVATGTAVLLLLSNKVVSSALIAPLEASYPPVPEFSSSLPLPADLAACRYVVVLGGGHVDRDGPSATNRLSDSSRNRLVEGLRVLHVLPEAKLVVSGRGVGANPSHAAVMAQAAVSLGVDPARIIRLDEPRDTSEEAAAIGRVVGASPFVLVTSAWHLRRAMAFMRHAGLRPVPCPADYTALRNADFRWRDCTWDSASLTRSTWAVYERLGYAWAWLRGKI